LRRIGKHSSVNFAQKIAVVVDFCMDARRNILMSKHHVFTDEVYWALVELKDRGEYISIDEAIRPLLGMPPGCDHPHLRSYEERLNDGICFKTEGVRGNRRMCPAV